MNKIVVSCVDHGILDKLFPRAIDYLPSKVQRRVTRYKVKEDRNNSLAAWLILCYAMGTQAFTILEKKNGKPELICENGVYGNISHCTNWCACILSNVETGIDIQDIKTYRPRVAERICTDQELDVLEHSNNKEIDFTSIWTMKECYLKMTGKGIGYGMDRVDTINMRNLFVTQQSNDYCMSAWRGKDEEETDRTTIEYIRLAEIL